MKVIDVPGPEAACRAAREPLGLRKSREFACSPRRRVSPTGLAQFLISSIADTYSTSAASLPTAPTAARSPAYSRRTLHRPRTLPLFVSPAPDSGRPAWIRVESRGPRSRESALLPPLAPGLLSPPPIDFAARAACRASRNYDAVRNAMSSFLLCVSIAAPRTPSFAAAS